ncbi:hypothetical protein F4780DRAFT_784649 [Xylariomycetidae sp. FL0641]|nr:hypothetical protein F4780DRAFT_784649 [Xylariomycetidae sp. FL0641]
MEYLAPLQTAGRILASAAVLLARLLYYITIPLHYPLYYAWALVAFLLSPFRVIFSLVLGSVSLVLGFVAKFKYLYVYLFCAALIGLTAGLALHGTSSLIFILFGIDAGTQEQRQARMRLEQEVLDKQQQQQQQQQQPKDEYEYDFGGEETTPTRSQRRRRSSLARLSSLLTSTTTTDSASSASRRLGDTTSSGGSVVLGGSRTTTTGGADQWRLVRAADLKPRRRRRGLLAQTIHEESSESDFT